MIKNKYFNLLVLLSLISVSILQAQVVGVGTIDPKGAFHIDAKGDNSATPTPSEQSNDVIISSSGKVGIGTISPTDKLDIWGNVAIQPNPTSNSSELQLFDKSGKSINMKAPEELSASYNFTLPNSQPINKYGIITDASGTTHWGTVTAAERSLASVGYSYPHNGNIEATRIPISPNCRDAITAAVPIDTYVRFFQEFSEVVIDNASCFSMDNVTVTPVACVSYPTPATDAVAYPTQTYNAPHTGRYIVSAYIVPNVPPGFLNATSSPSWISAGWKDFFYPVNLEVRKNCVANNPNSGTNIMDNAVIRWGTNYYLRYSVAIQGIVELNQNDKLNLVVFLGGRNSLTTEQFGMKFPEKFTYATGSDYQAFFSVTAL